MMRFRTWRAWARSLPWALRWFVYLTLCRPVLDTLYFLKDISPFLSPLNIIGVLTPVLVVFSLLTVTFPRRMTAVDGLIGLWAGLLFFNALAVLSIEVTAETLTIASKLVMVVFLYAFLRLFVQSREALHGLLTTFLYATIAPFGMLLYELLLEPLDVVLMTRGFTRHDGLYADVVGYAVYILGGFFVAAYFLVEAVSTPRFRRQAVLFAVVAGLTVVGLLSMHHTASWGVFGALVGLLVVHNVSPRKLPLLAALAVVGGVVVYFAGGAINERLAYLFYTDLAVLEGERGIESAFHGRMSRWMRYMSQWVADVPWVAKLFGVSTASRTPEVAMLLAGIHNDYLRILFATGIVGLLVYLAGFALVFLKSWGRPAHERFLVQGATAVFLLYGLSTVPTLYVPLITLVFTGIAYQALPARRPAVSATRRWAAADGPAAGASLRYAPPAPSSARTAPDVH